MDNKLENLKKIATLLSIEETNEIQNLKLSILYDEVESRILLLIDEDIVPEALHHVRDLMVRASFNNLTDEGKESTKTADNSTNYKDDYFKQFNNEINLYINRKNNKSLRVYC